MQQVGRRPRCPRRVTGVGGAPLVSLLTRTAGEVAPIAYGIVVTLCNTL